ncbi:S8 family peptidase [Baekduia sp.]|jgi:subtilisin family serine protease|uniref:S8 family peptidase n=1 Tax=Baekduia sp. TaxID=2600305 RepID=UPI002DF91E87|nr:S8 family peptidase [Baekduia sp.]
MPAVARALALVITTTLAALALTPISGASAATVSAPDGLTAKPAAVAKRHGPVTARAAQASATDPRTAEQWALQGDAPMGIDSAWRQTTGADVTVAIIDSGIDLGHPDLAPNLWTNAGEIGGNGIDDDGNGYVDDVHGYDFVDNDGTPQDVNGHGTHVAGIVGARGGNGIGGAGVAWQARLMAIRVLDDQARGTTAAVAAGIRYAVDNGARIINLSLAGPTSTPDLEDAVRYAQARGVLIVVAAGNDGADLSTSPTYPAAYGEDNVLGVAATTRDGGLSSVSDYGPGADVAAPGEQILSTALGGGYEWRTGTSMAAPEVAGALVLLAAARPDLDGNGLRDALLAGVRHTGLPVSAGALDVGAALHGVIAPGVWKNAPDEGLSSYTVTTAKSKTKSTIVKKATSKRKAKGKASSKAAKKTKARARAKARARKAKARKATARAKANRRGPRRHR